MLTGRESLIRLVGKRRHFLPNRQHLLSTDFPSSLNQFDDESGGIGASTGTSVEKKTNDPKADAEKDEAGVTETLASDRVTCPVCGILVDRGDYTINSHLDACLSRRKKRKFTQRTLLQLNFCSKLKVQVQPGEPQLFDSSYADNSSDGGVVEKDLYKPFAIDSTVKTESNQWQSPLNMESVMPTDIIGSTDSLVAESNYQNINTFPLPSETEVPLYDVDLSLDKISELTLETFIVGRKFSDQKELHNGMNISLQREPCNIKDPNAIKVISKGSEFCMVVGYLPQKVAQYLSPLIEKYSMEFEGWVTSVPTNSLNAAPIKIMCRKATLNGSKESDDNKDLTHLWANLLDALKSTKGCPMKTTKYQQNFCLMLQEVLRSYTHLFTDDEKVFLESFALLSDDCQRLFVRLYIRKGPWFRMSSISYPEVSDHEQAVKKLCEMGFLHSSKDTNNMQGNDWERILHTLTVTELREIVCTLKKKGHKGTRKQDLVASLLSIYEDGSCPFIAELLLDRIGMCIRITPKAEYLIWRSERLFFLNGEQDLSAFLLVDMGIVKYPTYKRIISDQIFSDRDELLAYEEAIEVAQIMDQSLDDDNIQLVIQCIKIADSRIFSFSDEACHALISQSFASFLSRFSASWIYSHVILLGVSILERAHRYRDAIKLLKSLLLQFTCDGRRGYWTLRMSIDLEHIGYIDESLSVAEEGLMDPWVRAGSRMALQRRVLRLGKPPRRWKTPSFAASLKRKIREVHIQGRPLNCEAGVKSRFYGEDGQQCGVEQLALQYYAREGGGWHGVHTESGIWLTIFGLLMWDIIFAEVPNVFCTKFQTAPLDLGTDSFYIARKSLIESHLQKIHNGLAEEILITSWESHRGVACRGVNWEKHPLSELRAAVVCIGGPCLALLCRHLAQDYRSWSSGMPDLLLWRFQGEYGGEAKLVEVKGPRDQLSEQQRAWLLLLMDCGFNTEVCRVRSLRTST